MNSMASKTPNMGVLGRSHTAGIYSDMTVDGPEIGTLVVIMDRAKNLPNRRTMGKQDPYVAARLGKEAKKTETDKRGGQTPRWDQELRFTVHDSVDYHNLKVSVFNDDKKTELIGETWVNLDGVLNPGGGQSDSWHSLNCKGKYAGEIRIELTYYDTRPKPEKQAAEKKRESTRPAEAQSHSLSGPRESAPVKRRPLPSDPTGASPSSTTTPSPHPRGLGQQSGPRSYPTSSQRTNEHTPTQQRRIHHPEQSQPADHRRPLPDSSGLITNPATTSHQGIPTHHAPQTYEPLASAPVGPYNDESFDMSYTAPKPYEVQPIDPLPQHVREHGQRTISHDDYRAPHQQSPAELPHSHSAPNVPTHHSFEHELVQQGHQVSYPPRPLGGNGQFHRSPEPYEEPSHNAAPLKLHHSSSRSEDWSNDQYNGSLGQQEPQTQYDPFPPQGRRASAMQPTVEDEDDIPPPPPVHRSNAATVPQPRTLQNPNYEDDAPAPLNISRYRAEPSPSGYDTSPFTYQGVNDYVEQSSGRRYTHPQPSTSGQPSSRPVSRHAREPSPSPLRHEITPTLPSSLIPGYDANGFERSERFHQDNQMSLVRTNTGDMQPYQVSPVYDTTEHARHISESNYQSPPQYETPPRHYAVAQQPAIQPSESAGYYPHSSPQEPQHMTPYQDPAPLIKPRAVSPTETRASIDNRASRVAVRGMPTRKSVSPRPPSSYEPDVRRLSGVAFSPDDFNVLNPNMAQRSHSGVSGDSQNGLDRHDSTAEVNEKGQVVTFSGRVIDASDHLPVDSWAPEPERKGQQKDRTPRERASLNGARDIRDRDIEAARQRERERKERDRYRTAAPAPIEATGNPSSALVSSRHHASASMASNGSPGSMVVASRYQYSNNLAHSAEPAILPDLDSVPGSRNRLQKRDRRPMSTYVTPTHSPSHIPSPSGAGNSNPNVLRERENVGGHTGSPGYGARHSVAGPPIPAKVPITEGPPPQGDELMALSRELQSIDIGPGGGGTGRNRTAQRRRYGGGGY